MFEQDKITYYLHLTNSDEQVSDWIEFLPEPLTKDKDFVQQKISLLLFIESEDELYVVVGGNAWQMIIGFVDESFGINTYERILQPNADELTSIQSRGITGQRVGMREQFRDDYRLINYIKFGKLPQELDVKLAAVTGNLHFRFLKTKSNERIKITAGKAIKFNKEVDFEKLHQIIQEFGQIKQLEPSDYLSSYKEITNQEYISKNLYKLLIDKLYNNIPVIEGRSTDPNDQFDFDFCHPSQIDNFYKSEKFVLRELTPAKGHAPFATVEDRSDIYKTVILRALDKMESYNKFDFQVYLQGVRVSGYRGDKQICTAPFLYYISAEFSDSGHAVFRIDNKWYNLKSSFIEDLKINTQHVFREFKAPPGILKHPWDKALIRTEGDYNLLYQGHPNYIVMDTVIVDALELCDILYYDDNNTYLVHVKYGFGSKMRELTNQILLSAKRLTEARGTPGLPYIEQLFEALLQKGYSVNGLSLNEFRGLFFRKISYVLATASHLRDDLVIEDNIEAYTSNIARFSVTQCSSEMRTSYFDMLIHQIVRT